MREKSMTCMREEWENMSTEQLDELLQAELQKEHPNEEVVLQILDILNKRDSTSPEEISQQIRSAWSKYKERVSAPIRKSHSHKWILSATAVAAAICVVVLALPRTVDAESIFDMLFRWTSSIFQFVDPSATESTPQVFDAFVTDNSGLQQLHDELVALGVAESVVPMWLPAGSTLSELKVTQMPDGNKVRAKLEGSDYSITLSYRVFISGAPMQYEKENAPVEIYDYFETNHFIMDNDENLLVAWNAEGIECSFSTDLDKETIYKIIKSIYRSGLF